jgi:hypothetical protein
MGFVINIENLKRNNQGNGGKKKLKFKNEWEEVLYEEEKRVKREKRAIQKIKSKEPVIVILSKVYQEKGYQGIKELFQEWNQTEAKELIDEINEIDFVRVLKLLYNQYLNQFLDCRNTNRNKTKVKKIKYKFEKDPKSKKQIEKEFHIQRMIEVFVEQMEQERLELNQ